MTSTDLAAGLLLGRDPLVRPRLRWVALVGYPVAFGALASALVALGGGAAGHDRLAPVSAAALVAVTAVAGVLWYLYDPTGPQWRRSPADRQRLVAILAGEPARERWLAADLLRITRRRRRSGAVLVAMWLGIAVGAAVGLLIGDGRLLYAMQPAVLALLGLFQAPRLDDRARTLTLALEAAGIR